MFTLEDPRPRIGAKTIDEFLDSPQGNASVALMDQYVFVNHMSRQLYVQALLELKQEIEKDGHGDFNHILKDDQYRHVVTRLIEIEVVCNAFMASEDFATFCLAFRSPLEDMPSVMNTTPTKDIWQFFEQASAAPLEYFKRLWVYSDPSSFLVTEHEQKLIDIIQHQNCEFLSFLTKQLLKFRGFYNELWNRYKHGFSIDFPTLLTGGPICTECLNVVTVPDKKAPSQKHYAFILGQDAINIAKNLHSLTMHALEALLRSRLNWLIFDGWRNPPTVVYGRNPLDSNDWMIYQRTVNLLLPKPRHPWPLVPKKHEVVADVEKLFRWLHSKDLQTHWLTVMPEQFFFAEWSCAFP